MKDLLREPCFTPTTFITIPRAGETQISSLGNFSVQVRTGECFVTLFFNLTILSYFILSYFIFSP